MGVGGELLDKCKGWVGMVVILFGAYYIHFTNTICTSI